MDFSAVVQQVLELLAPVVGTAIAAGLLFLGRQAYAWLQSKIKQSDLDYAAQLVDRFVLAAEQAGLTDELLAVGEAKRAYVLGLLEAELEKKNIRVDLDVLAELIEASVAEQFNWLKITKSPAG